MKKLLEAINRGILKGLNENTIELLADLDDENLDLTGSILTKSMNNKIDYSIKQLLVNAIQTGKTSRGLKQLINDPNNFSKFKGLIKANDKEHLEKLISIGLTLFGDDGNFNWIDTSGITDMSSLFYGSDFNGHIELWDVSNVTNMEDMFLYAEKFNLPIGDWDVSNVTNMAYMFRHAISFNQPIGNWDVSNVTNMAYMFCYAEKFNQLIGDWDVKNVTDMDAMFDCAIAFNQPICRWDVSNVTNMRCMFNYSLKFNLPIGNWDVSNVTNMTLMFEQAKNFNQNISLWNVKKVTSHSRMYYHCPLKDEYKPKFNNNTLI